VALVANDTPRVYGIDTKSPVVLIEGERTNVRTNSHRPDFTDYWDRFTIVGTNDGGPFGTGYSTFTVDDISNSYMTYTNQGAQGMIPSNAIYSVSIYLKGTTNTIGKNFMFSSKYVIYGTNTNDGLQRVPASGWEEITLTNDWQRFNFVSGFKLPDSDSAAAKGINRVDVEPRFSNSGPAGAWVIGDSLYMSGFQYEVLAPFPSSPIDTSSGVATTRAADTYTLGVIPYRSGDKMTLNIAGYFDASRPGTNARGHKHYWWTHAANSWIRQDGDKLEVAVNGLPLRYTVPASGWVPVTLKQFGDYVEVWIDGGFKGRLDTTIGYHTSEAYTPSNTEEYAFTYLAFGAYELNIPFVNPYEAMPNTIPYHTTWKAELEKIGVTYGS